MWHCSRLHTGYYSWITLLCCSHVKTGLNFQLQWKLVVMRVNSLWLLVEREKVERMNLDGEQRVESGDSASSSSVPASGYVLTKW